MTRRVGTFGGYKGRVVDIRPDCEGLLTFAAAGTPGHLRLFWDYGATARHNLCEIRVPGEKSGADARDIPGWVTLLRAAGEARSLLSRASPGVRIYHGSGD